MTNETSETTVPVVSEGVKAPQESDLMLDYISGRAALILSAAAASDEISHAHCVELRDTIGDLIGEVERLLGELNRV